MKHTEYILLVDDDDITNYLTQRLLSRLRPMAEIKIANNGEEALQIIEQSKANNQGCPDLILLDVNMPVMNGLEFLNKFAADKLRPKCRIVAVTTSSNRNDFIALKKHGIKEILPKPLTQSSIAEILTAA